MTIQASYQIVVEMTRKEQNVYKIKLNFLNLQKFKRDYKRSFSTAIYY